MILAAGLGTRLRPFTETHPKALYPVGGKPLLQHALEHMAAVGIQDIIVNVHHFAEQIISFLDLNQNFGLNIAISDESGELLETGGGLKKAAWFFEGTDAVVVRNVDILTDLDLRSLIGAHRNSRALATLAVRNRVTSRYFLFDNRMNLCGWCNVNTGERTESRTCSGSSQYAFSGIQVIHPQIFSLIIETGSFSLTSLYLRLAKEYEIAGFVDESPAWEDVGKIKQALR